jgi:hypothetical protein
MDIFGLSDVIKRRKKMLDSIDQPVTKAAPVSPAPASPPVGGAYQGMSQQQIDEIRAKRKKLDEAYKW